MYQSILKPDFEAQVGGKPPEELIRELESADVHVGARVMDVMSAPSWSSGKSEKVKFGCSRVHAILGDLGAKANHGQLLARIRELGHAPLEPCDGPAVRLAYKRQNFPTVFGASAPMMFDGRPYIYRFECRDGGELGLFTAVAPLEEDWPGNALIFYRFNDSPAGN